MRMIFRIWIYGVIVSLGGSSMGLAAPPIPEPGLTLYGVVRNVQGGANVRMIVGAINIMVQPQAGAPIVVVEASLRNVNDQFSYVAQVPFATSAPGLDPVETALELTADPSLYTLSATIQGEEATIVPEEAAAFQFSRAERGALMRVDFEVSVESNDADNDGIPDSWEEAFDVDDPDGDPDGDGLTTLEEYLAGTDPTDANSSFEFIGLEVAEAGGVTLSWSSVAGKVYVVERSTSILEGFEAIRTGIAATPPVNTFTDPEAFALGEFFYRLRITP